MRGRNVPLLVQSPGSQGTVQSMPASASHMGPLYPADAWGHKGSWRWSSPKGGLPSSWKFWGLSFWAGDVLVRCLLMLRIFLHNTDCIDCFLCTDELRSAYNVG